MSSHNSQSFSGSNYALRLQNMRLSEDLTNEPLQVSHRRTSSLNGTTEPKAPIKSTIPLSNRVLTTDDDYKLYDQNKFITASKLTGPKESASSIHQVNRMISVSRNLARSPTQSISGMSQQSVYENIDCYNPVTQQPLPPPPAYHYISNNKSTIGSGTYEVIGRKYDPNDSAMSRFTHTPQPDDADPSHIYENLGNPTERKLFKMHNLQSAFG